tara:strand:- start:1073 stop:1357 length:285 start_codon:yes stop_codon:yes gene_type:complete
MNNIVDFDNEIVIEQSAQSEKEEKMVEYIRSLRELEEAMEPYKEQKRELKKEFLDADWLTKEEISMTVKAYRLLKDDNFDLTEFNEIYKTLRSR